MHMHVSIMKYKKYNLLTYAKDKCSLISTQSVKLKQIQFYIKVIIYFRD